MSPKSFVRFARAPASLAASLRFSQAVTSSPLKFTLQPSARVISTTAAELSVRKENLTFPEKFIAKVLEKADMSESIKRGALCTKAQSFPQIAKFLEEEVKTDPEVAELLDVLRRFQDGDIDVIQIGPQLFPPQLIGEIQAIRDELHRQSDNICAIQIIYALMAQRVKMEDHHIISVITSEADQPFHNDGGDLVKTSGKLRLPILCNTLFADRGKSGIETVFIDPSDVILKLDEKIIEILMRPVYKNPYLGGRAVCHPAIAQMEDGRWRIYIPGGAIKSVNDPFTQEGEEESRAIQRLREATEEVYRENSLRVELMAVDHRPSEAVIFNNGAVLHARRGDLKSPSQAIKPSPDLDDDHGRVVISVAARDMSKL